MALVRNPIDRRAHSYIRVNDMYDNQDVVVENSLSQKKQFQDVERTSQLTQNAWNMSPFTRSDAYRDVTLLGVEFVGRMQRYPGTVRVDRYRQ